VKIGDVITRQRTFTNQEILLFGELTRNAGLVHQIPDELGRLMVQGLLTASLLTEIGGELNLLAREMNFIFLRPVYSGDIITCVLKIDNLQQMSKVTKIWVSWEFINQNKEPVLTGNGEGILVSGKEQL
jgi:acyl dehydratase